MHRSVPTSPPTKNYLALNISVANIGNPWITWAQDATGQESISSKIEAHCIALLSLQFLESCDEVILLEDGEICEKGTHKELMEERGRYAKLIHNLRGLQFKVSLSLLRCKRLGAFPYNFWPGEVLSFRFQRNFILSLGSWAHVRCSSGGSP